MHYAVWKVQKWQLQFYITCKVSNCLWSAGGQQNFKRFICSLNKGRWGQHAMVKPPHHDILSMSRRKLQRNCFDYMRCCAVQVELCCENEWRFSKVFIKMIKCVKKKYHSFELRNPQSLKCAWEILDKNLLKERNWKSRASFPSKGQTVISASGPLVNSVWLHMPWC